MLFLVELSLKLSQLYRNDSFISKKKQNVQKLSQAISNNIGVHYGKQSSSKVQKQPYADALQNRCSYKLCKIHRKTPVSESLFKKKTLA